jgi:small GTP-binding protein
MCCFEQDVLGESSAAASSATESDEEEKKDTKGVAAVSFPSKRGDAFVSPLHDLLVRLELLGVHKHVPQVLLGASYQLRMQVLAGFIDTDGSYNKKQNVIRIVQSARHRRLLTDIVQLAKSCGFRVFGPTKGFSSTRLVDGTRKKCKTLAILISGNHQHEIPMKVPYKQVPVDASAHSQGDMNRFGFEIKKVEEKGDSYGFRVVGANKRFLLDDLTVTHNSGDARVALIGFPSVGKSTLLSTLTNTHSEQAAYEFTTLTCIPGVINYKDARIQLLDLPGIIEGAAKGKGRGRQVIGVARTSDLVILMLDAAKAEIQKELLTMELDAVGIRINQKRPNITIRHKKTGGVSVTSTCGDLTHIDVHQARNILHLYKVSKSSHSSCMCE